MSVISVAITLSCGDAVGPQTTVRIEPDTISLAPGEQVQLRLVVVRNDGSEREKSADSWHSASPNVARVDGNGLVTGIRAGFTPIYAELQGRRVSAPAAVGKVTYRNIRDFVISLYDSAAWWPAIHLTAPAIAVDDRTVDSNLPKVITRWISTAYIGNRYYNFRVFPDGQVLVHYDDAEARLKPAGRQRVLVLITDFGDTDIREKLDLWEEAQDSVNGDHRALAAALGYKSPLVQFENTNVLVSRDSTGDPQHPDSVYATLRRLGYEPAAYEIVVSLVMTPQIRTGYANTFLNLVTVGCYCPIPAQGQRVRLERATLDLIAEVIYHHEIGHLWGWAEEWGGGPERTRIITNPVLFGWTDTDGDGVPEIIDPTPYGIASPPRNP